MATYADDLVNKVEALNLKIKNLQKVIRQLKCDNYNLRLELRDLKEIK